MEILAWLLVVLFAGLSLYLWRRESTGAMEDEALRPLVEDLRSGWHPAPPGDPEEPETVRELREVLHRGWVPRESERREAQEAALRGMATYLEARVTRSLGAAVETGEDLRNRALDAVHALEDLEFFARDIEEEALQTGSLGEVIQEVTREFTREYEVPVKFTGPEHPVRVPLAEELVKDALYLLLVNAARFGGEGPVEVRLDTRGKGWSVQVADRGRGFSPEALERGPEPFFTTEPGSLGLGLTWVRQVADRHGWTLQLSNRPDGGARVELILPSAS